MIIREITVTNPKGLHARPSAMLVKTASKFKSDITIINGQVRADAKSVLGIMTLCAKVGTVLKLEVIGEDEKEAIDAVEYVFTVTFPNEDI